MKRRLVLAGHAPDQQRRRRHQLRDARALPSAARVRPRPARRARASSCGSREPGEKMETLDGVERELSARRPPDLRRRARRAGHRRDHGRRGGGGLRRHHRRSCSSRRTSRRRASPRRRSGSGLRSEASARFERGVDPNDVAAGAARAMELLAEVAARAAGRRARSTCTRSRSSARASTVRTERVNQLLATDARRRRHRRRCSTPLGIEVDDGTAIVPTWRPDIEREIDLVEEVARRIGLDQITRTVPSNPEKIGALTAGAARAPRWSPTCSSAPATTRSYTLPLLAPADLARAGVADRRADRGREPAARRGVDAAAGAAAGRAARGRAQRRARQSRCRRSSSSVTCSRRPRRATRCRSSGCTSPSRASGRVVRTPYEPDRDVTVHDLDRGRRGARAGAAARRLAARSPRRRPASIRCAPRDDRGRRRRRRCGRRDRRRGGRRARRWPVRSSRARSTSTRCSRRRASPRAATSGVALSRRRRSTSRSSSPTTFPPARSCARCARPAASCSSRSRLFDVFRSDALGAGQGEPRVRAAVPRARPHADRRRGRRAAPAVHRRGRRRRSAPSCGR